MPIDFLNKNVHVLERHWDTSIRGQTLGSVLKEDFWNKHAGLKKDIYEPYKKEVIDLVLSKYKSPIDPDVPDLQRYASLAGQPYPTNVNDIEKIYRRAALKLHPDKGGDTAEFQRFESLTKDYKEGKKPIPSEEGKGGNELQYVLDKRLRTTFRDLSEPSYMGGVVEMSRVSSISFLRTSTYALSYGLLAPSLAVAGMNVDNKDQ